MQVTGDHIRIINNSDKDRVNYHEAAFPGNIYRVYYPPFAWVEKNKEPVMIKDPLKDYLASKKDPSPSFICYLSSLQCINSTSGETVKLIIKELEDQRNNLKLIASENYCSLAVQFAMGNLLTDKYAEGYPEHRFYAGCGNVDAVENLAIENARKIFGCDHAYIQPHSGADANLIAFWAILKKKIEAPFVEVSGKENINDITREDWNKLRTRMGNQRLLSLDYYSGGHLTHGYRNNVSSQMFDVYSYTVDKNTGLLDYENIRDMAVSIKPLILLAGYSAYPRKINFKKMREIADEAGAVLMVDMAHFAGLVAGKVFTGDFDPVIHADVVTTTTHKTLRGPRGGLVLCRNEFAEFVDKGCPLVIGGPLPHVMAAKAVSLVEASKKEFSEYAERITANAKSLASYCIDNGMCLATGGTDNHLMLIDVRPYGLTGRQAESALRECGITLNRNSLPFDTNGPWYTSGLRIGTPAVTTLGMGDAQMRKIAELIKEVLVNTKSAVLKNGEKSRTKYTLEDKIKTDVKEGIRTLLSTFVLYPEIDLEYLKKAFC
jgi:glycine hydroxymethyltransferase